MIRCRISAAAPRCGARCQFGFALRKDPAGVGAAVVRRLVALLSVVGTSRTNGKTVGSSLFPARSWHSRQITSKIMEGKIDLKHRLNGRLVP